LASGEPDRLIWYHVSEFFGFPFRDVAGWIRAIEIDDETWDDTASEEFRELFVMELQFNIADAFERLMPKDIPGYVVFDFYYDQWVLGYTQDITEKEAKEISERLDKKIRESNERWQEAQRKEDLERQAELSRLLKGWELPDEETFEQWVLHTFDLDTFYEVAIEERESKRFKKDLLLYGEASVGLEQISHTHDEGYNVDIANYYAIPEHVIEAHENVGINPGWELFPGYHAMFSVILNKYKPDVLPGWFDVDEDPEHRFVTSVIYLERGEGGEEGEEEPRVYEQEPPTEEYDETIDWDYEGDPKEEEEEEEENE